jgi:serine/threonine protein kinase
MSPEILNGDSYGRAVDFYTLGVLYYEMIVGLPPNYNENKILMYKDIRTKPAIVPKLFGADVRDLIESLLKIDPAERLGTRGGAAEIKKHEFFKDIDWDLLMKQ